jgi:ABC-type glutathione transport system ATPase component
MDRRRILQARARRRFLHDHYPSRVYYGRDRAVSRALPQQGAATNLSARRDVELRYPTRPDVLALDKVSIRLEPGKAYAFAGTSGAGKSSESIRT